MKFTSRAGDLTKAASTAAASSNSKSNIAMLSNLLVAVGDGVSFTGSNLKGNMTAFAVAEVEEPGSVAVDGRIAKLLGGLPADATVKITSTDVVTLQCGRSRYQVDTLPAADFPPSLTAGDEAVELVLSDDDRRRLFATPAAAISDEEARYYLRGVSLKLVDGRLVACGTDGHQLIRASIAALTSSDLLVRGVIVPGDACATIAKLSGCTLRVSNNIIEARTEDRLFAHKLVEATYPGYERAIPAASAVNAEVDRVELIDALKRVLCVATKAKSVIKVAQLEWGNNELFLTLPRQPDVAADVLPAITASNGKNSKTSFAVGAFIDLLDELDAERVLLDAGEEEWAPIRITLPGDDDFVAVRMPCRA
jgi:DNA polymerase III subunit beta